MFLETTLTTTRPHTYTTYYTTHNDISQQMQTINVYNTHSHTYELHIHIHTRIHIHTFTYIHAFTLHIPLSLRPLLPAEARIE
jgi:hypothetical protein